MRASVIAACLALAACVNVQGANQRLAAETAIVGAPDYPVAVDLPAGTYRLDPRHVSVQFRIRHMNIGWFVARFDTRDATLDLDPQDPSRSRLTASVDATSVNTGVLGRSGERAFDGEMADALGGGTISFTSTGIERTGQFTARVTGDLAMNGQTHPTTLDVTFLAGRSDPLQGGATSLGFSARGLIRRSEWGVTAWRLFAGDEVEIVIDAELGRQ